MFTWLRTMWNRLVQNEEHNDDDKEEERFGRTGQAGVAALKFWLVQCLIVADMALNGVHTSNHHHHKWSFSSNGHFWRMDERPESTRESSPMASGNHILTSLMINNVVWRLLRSSEGSMNWSISTNIRQIYWQRG